MTDMGLFIFNGQGLSDDEVALGTPDITEARNLEHHVERCAMRYRLFTRRQASQGNDIAQIKYMLLGMLALMVITSPQIRGILEYLGKVL